MGPDGIQALRKIYGLVDDYLGVCTSGESRPLECSLDGPESWLTRDPAHGLRSTDALLSCKVSFLSSTFELIREGG